MTIDRVAGVEVHALPASPPPAHDSLPWACTACGGWVSHVERIYTDEGLFHDRVSCLTDDRFEELVAKYGCRCPVDGDGPVYVYPGTYDSDDLDRIAARRDR